MNIYIHLLNGEPAYFDEHSQVILVVYRCGQTKPAATSLRQIRREQEISKETRAKWCKRSTFASEWKYDYARYSVPGKAR